MRIFVPGRMLPVLRRELSRELPEYGRARLCEAMSAAFGYATHAARKAQAKGSPIWWISAFDFDPKAAARRLVEMGETVDEERVVGAFEKVFRDAGVVQTGPWHYDGLVAMLRKFHESGFDALEPRERVSLAIHYLSRKIAPSDPDVAAAETRLRRERDLVGILVDALRTRRWMDPDVADLVIASISNPDGGRPGEWTTGRCIWMEAILKPMSRRIEYLLFAIVATWRGPVGSGELPPIDAEGFRDPRVSGVRRVGMVQRYGDGRDRIAIGDADASTTGRADAVLAVYAFAAFVRGDRSSEIRSFLEGFPEAWRYKSPDRVLRRCMALVSPHPSVGGDLVAYYRRIGALTLDPAEGRHRDVRLWFALDRRSRPLKGSTIEGLRGDLHRMDMRTAKSITWAIHDGAEIIEIDDTEEVDQVVRDRIVGELCGVAQAGICKVVIVTRDASLASYASVLEGFPSLATMTDFEVGVDVPRPKPVSRNRDDIVMEA